MENKLMLIILDYTWLIKIISDNSFLEKCGIYMCVHYKIIFVI